MKRILILIALLAASLAGPAAAQIEGDWEITAEVTLLLDERPVGAEMADCFYSGVGSFSQTGADFDGPVNLDLDSGIPDCPGTLSGTADGTDSGGNISGTITGTPPDALDFGGSPTAAAAIINQYSGSLTVTNGGFAGSTGSWTAVRAPTMPAASTLALALLALLLAGAGVLALRRARNAA